MNTSPRKDIEMRQSVVTYMTMKALENILEKGQKNGDATKVVTSGEVEIIDDLAARMETKTENHQISLDNKCRVLPNGEKMHNDRINLKRKELQEAIIREQNEASLDNDDIEK